jgi:hypothetical protein
MIDPIHFLGTGQEITAAIAEKNVVDKECLSLSSALEGCLQKSQE